VPFDLDTQIGNADSIYGSPEAVWGSAATSLEYYVDDFAIAQFAARSLRDRSAYATFMPRSGEWRRLYDPASGMIEPRFEDRAFRALTTTSPRSVSSRATRRSTPGWCPGPGRALRPHGREDGGGGQTQALPARPQRRPGGTRTDHALLGNEPTLQTPWLYDWTGRPFRTQEAVRRALTLYSPTPEGYPGNDDLGTLSAWYVFGALASTGDSRRRRAGDLQPALPAGGDQPSHRRRATLSVVGRGPYIDSLDVGGRAYGRPWVSYCEIAAGADLEYRLSTRPNRAWGTAAGAAPPSYGPRHPMSTSSCGP